MTPAAILARYNCTYPETIRVEDGDRCCVCDSPAVVGAYRLTTYAAPHAWPEEVRLCGDPGCRDEHEAGNERRALALSKLQQHIDAGKRSSPEAISRIMSEQPVDRVVRAQSVLVEADHDCFELGSSSGATGVRTEIGRLNDHALGQLSERVHFPGRYLSELRGTDWGRDLIASNLNELATHRPATEKLLVREVNGTVRGVLSNGYRPDDSRPAVDALIGVAREAGALITSATWLENRISVKLMMAEPVEVFPGEYMVFGLDFRTGDYGGVARELMGWALRLVCLNGMVRTANYRKVHLGARIQDEVEYSNRTRKLNDAFTTSATRDMARALIGTEAVRKQVAQIQAANGAALDPDAAIASLRKKVNKAEEAAIVGKFNSPDVELLPPGNTSWRWSNAISWLATQTEDQNRRLDLEEIAGDVIPAAA